MKFQLSAPTALNSFSAYGDGFVMVNGERHEASMIVMPERILPWNVATFDALAEADFEVFLDLGLEVLLLGTGARQRFPHPRLTQALARRRVGVEVMDLHAACRTYNVLIAEQRRVGAALLFR